MQYARNPTVLWRSTSRGPVLLTPDAEEVQVLRGLAAAVWELLDVPMTVETLAVALAELLGASVDPAAVLDDLMVAGLVHST